MEEESEGECERGKKERNKERKKIMKEGDETEKRK